MQLSDLHIEIIKDDIKKRGISSDALGEDLLDHICLLVEDELNETVEFKTAYLNVVSKFGSFKFLQEETTKEITSASLLTKIYKYFDYAFTLFYILLGCFSLVFPFVVLYYHPIEVFVILSPVLLFGYIVCFTRINYKKFELIQFK